MAVPKNISNEEKQLLNNLLKQINQVNDVYANLISVDTFDWDIIPTI